MCNKQNANVWIVNSEARISGVFKSVVYKRIIIDYCYFVSSSNRNMYAWEAGFKVNEAFHVHVLQMF